MRFPRPGNCTEQTSMSGNKCLDQALKREGNPPAQGKQNKRKEAPGLGLGRKIQGLEDRFILC